MGALPCWCVSLCDKTSRALLQWSEAPSAHSHRRHPYHLPGQARGCREIHLQSEQQPRYLALGVGLPDCSVWVLPWQQSGGGGAGRRYSELCEESSSSSMEAACVGGCCIIWQRCSAAVMQRNLLEFQGQMWQRGSTGRYDWACLTISIFWVNFNDIIIISSDSSLIPVHKDGDGLVLRLHFSWSLLNLAPPKWNGDLPVHQLWPMRAKRHSWPSDVSSSALVCWANLLPSRCWPLITALQYESESWGIHSTAGTDFITGLKYSRP